jgi:leucyl-tRNA synthetase
MLSDSPPERDLEWTDAGVDGAWRYINRLWRLVNDAKIPAAGTPMPSLNEKADKARRATHRAIADVTSAFERFHFNGAVAKVRELSNVLDGLDSKDAGEAWALRQGLEALTQLAGPMLPHIAEEMWEKLGYKKLLCETAWPQADPALLIEDSVTVAVQVNGKLRATLTLPRDSSQKEAEAAALANENVRRAMNGNPAKKVIVVANKIVNIVA